MSTRYEKLARAMANANTGTDLETYCWEAATAIRELSAEVERLREAITELGRCGGCNGRKQRPFTFGSPQMVDCTECSGTGLTAKARSVLAEGTKT